MYSPLLAMIGIFICIVTLAYSVISVAKNRVVTYLSERGAKNIIVRREWTIFDNSTLTFFVEFTHPNGSKGSTRCTIRTWMFYVGQEIFWSEPLELKTPKNKVKKEEAKISMLKEKRRQIQNLPSFFFPFFSLHRLRSIVLFHCHNMLVDQMRVSILQADEVILDRIRLGAFEDEETSLLDTFAGDLAAHGFSDEFR